MGKIVYASLGSNLGDRFENLKTAISSIQKNIGKVSKISSIYITPPWGFESNNDFFNACIEFSTESEPEEILIKFEIIENQLGRKRKSSGGYTSRPIDIDILTYGREIILSEKLCIPHPRLDERNFVLLPLAEIAPTFVHPKSRKSIQQLIADCQDEAPYKIYEKKISFYDH